MTTTTKKKNSSSKTSATGGAARRNHHHHHHHHHKRTNGSSGKHSKPKTEKKPSSSSESKALVRWCSETGDKILISTLTLRDIKQIEKAALTSSLSSSSNSSSSLSSSSSYALGRKKKQLVRIPSLEIRQRCYRQAANAIQYLEERLLPTYGGRPWRVHVQLDEPAGRKTPLFRWYRGNLELAVLPHLLRTVPSHTTVSQRGLAALLERDTGRSSLSSSALSSSSSSSSVSAISSAFSTSAFSTSVGAASSRGYGNGSGYGNGNGRAIGGAATAGGGAIIASLDGEPPTAPSERQVSSLSSYCWTEASEEYGIPIVTLRWTSPNHQHFRARRQVEDHARQLVHQQLLLDRVLCGRGARGQRLLPSKCTRSEALKAGKIRFLRDGLWVIGQEESWQRPRQDELRREEQKRDELLRREERERLLAGTEVMDLVVVDHDDKGDLVGHPKNEAPKRDDPALASTTTPTATAHATPAGKQHQHHDEDDDEDDEEDEEDDNIDRAPTRDNEDDDRDDDDDEEHFDDDDDDDDKDGHHPRKARTYGVDCQTAAKRRKPILKVTPAKDRSQRPKQRPLSTVAFYLQSRRKEYRQERLEELRLSKMSKRKGNGGGGGGGGGAHGGRGANTAPKPPNVSFTLREAEIELRIVWKTLTKKEQSEWEKRARAVREEQERALKAAKQYQPPLSPSSPPSSSPPKSRQRDGHKNSNHQHRPPALDKHDDLVHVDDVDHDDDEDDDDDDDDDIAGDGAHEHQHDHQFGGKNLVPESSAGTKAELGYFALHRSLVFEHLPLRKTKLIPPPSLLPKNHHHHRHHAATAGGGGSSSSSSSNNNNNGRHHVVNNLRDLRAVRSHVFRAVEDHLLDLWETLADETEWKREKQNGKLSRPSQPQQHHRHHQEPEELPPSQQQQRQDSKATQQPQPQPQQGENIKKMLVRTVTAGESELEESIMSSSSSSIPPSPPSAQAEVDSAYSSSTSSSRPIKVQPTTTKRKRPRSSPSSSAPTSTQRRFGPSSLWRMSEQHVELCYDAVMDHYDAVMNTVKARDLNLELADGFDVMRERGRGRYDMELPAFDTDRFAFLTDLNGAPWMPIVREILGEDVVLIHKGAFLSLPGAASQAYHQDGPHLTTRMQRPCHAVNVFVPLVDLHTKNGPTEFCLGSHILGFDDFRASTVFVPIVPAGTPIIFDYRLGHRGLANSDSHCRPIVYCTYAAAKDGKEFRDSVNFSRKRYHRIGRLIAKPLSRDERTKKRQLAMEEQEIQRAVALSLAETTTASASVPITHNHCTRSRSRRQGGIGIVEQQQQQQEKKKKTETAKRQNQKEEKAVVPSNKSKPKQPETAAAAAAAAHDQENEGIIIHEEAQHPVSRPRSNADDDSDDDDDKKLPPHETVENNSNDDDKAKEKLPTKASADSMLPEHDDDKKNSNSSVNLNIQDSLVNVVRDYSDSPTPPSTVPSTVPV